MILLECDNETFENLLEETDNHIYVVPKGSDGSGKWFSLKFRLDEKTPSELSVGKSGKGIPVPVCCYETKEVFKSMTGAAEAFGCKSASIRYSINNMTKCRGHYFFKWTGPESRRDFETNKKLKDKAAIQKFLGR